MRYILVVFFFLNGCTKEAVNTYCKQHAEIHSQHKAQIVQLEVNYNGTGQLYAKLAVPADLIVGSVDKLQDVKNVMSATSQKICLPEKVILQEEDGVIRVDYRFDCGQGAELKRVDINLLDTFSELDEVEAYIETHVVQKQFVISRHCSKPIFVL